MPNTNAAMTAARITVIATIRMTPMTGDTASSFLVYFILKSLQKCPQREQDYVYGSVIVFLYIYVSVSSNEDFSRFHFFMLPESEISILPGLYARLDAEKICV
jgi:hypothetical protein